MKLVDRRGTAWQRLLLFVVLSLATRWLSLVIDVIDLDESAHIVGSWEMMRGRLLYAQFVDNKPPLLYEYYALAQVLSGRGLFAVHLLTVLVTVPLTAYAVSAFFGHRREGLVAGVVFLLYSAAFIGHDMLSANTEILMLLPATWAVALLRDERDATIPWRVAGAGALIAVACLFRYQAATWALAFAAGIVIAGRTSESPVRLRRPSSRSLWGSSCHSWQFGPGSRHTGQATPFSIGPSPTIFTTRKTPSPLARPASVRLVTCCHSRL
jgi:hypothetical protein